MRRTKRRNGARGARWQTRAWLLLAAVLAGGCVGAPSGAGDPSDPAAGAFLEAEDPRVLTWVTPLSATVVDADEPVDLVVATQHPDARIVHFAVDGQEVGACDPSAPDADCAEDDLWSWTTTFATPGAHTVTASFVDASGAPVVATQQVTVVADAQDAPVDTVGADDEPDPLADDQLVAEGESQIVDAITSARGYIDPDLPSHRACGGVEWSLHGGRVLLAHGRIDGSASRAAGCWQRYHDSIQRYADLHYVSRASLVAAAVAAGDCDGGSDDWRRGLVRASACAALTHTAPADCAHQMATNADFAFRVAAEYLARPGARRRHHNDPPREAALLATGAVHCSLRDPWHLRAPAGYIDRFVGAYNAYRTAGHMGLLDGTYTNPLLREGAGAIGYCGAPDVRRDGDRYVMVCASEGVGHVPDAYHVRTSPDLVDWGPERTVFTPEHHPRWALTPGRGGAYWCPEIYRIDGRWVLLFAALSPARSSAVGRSMAIGQAVADTLDGPWTPSDAPLIAQGDRSQPEPYDGKSGRIDPSLLLDADTQTVYRDAAGDMYMYYVYQPRYVRVVRVRSDGRGHLATVPGTNHELMLTTGQQFTTTYAWERTVIEGVEAQRRGDEVYLLYAGASAWDASYATGVARAASPDGPFEKHGEPVLSTAAGGALVGPGHSSQWVQLPDGRTYLPYRVERRADLEAAGGNGHRAPQLLALDPVTFDTQGWPVVGDGHPSERAMSIP